MLTIETTKKEKMNYNVYFKSSTSGELGKMVVKDVECHEEAILLVKEGLVLCGEGYALPILAVIN